MGEELRLKMRGSVFRDVWLPRAEKLSLAGEIDLDLAEVASRVRVKRVGGGYRAYLSMTFEQGERWATWLPKAHADQLLKLIGEQRAAARGACRGRGPR